jgi:hypothetical protein
LLKTGQAPPTKTSPSTRNFQKKLINKIYVNLRPIFSENPKFLVLAVVEAYQESAGLKNAHAGTSTIPVSTRMLFVADIGTKALGFGFLLLASGILFYRVFKNSVKRNRSSSPFMPVAKKKMLRPKSFNSQILVSKKSKSTLTIL